MFVFGPEKQKCHPQSAQSVRQIGLLLQSPKEDIGFIRLSISPFQDKLFEFVLRPVAIQLCLECAQFGLGEFQ
jgi:hypothetical protein